MPLYEAEIEIPMDLTHGDELDRFVQGLREFGHPKIVLRVVAKNKETAASEVANSVSVWWGFRGRFTKDWWLGAFKAVRDHKLREEYPDPESWS